jgi:hypothetical protein
VSSMQDGEGVPLKGHLQPGQERQESTIRLGRFKENLKTLSPLR